jgi:hypothetical protein
MSTKKLQIQSHLTPLVGRKLSIARRAADMRGFHFGRVTVEEPGDRSGGEFALHIQCPWRLEGPAGILTGQSDLWEPAEPSQEIDWDSWDYEKDPNLQDRRIGELLGGYDPKTRSFVNDTEHLVVEKVEADDFGGAAISLSGGYRLVIFPSGSAGEDWRLLQPLSEQRHFVVSGGAVDPSADEAG